MFDKTDSGFISEEQLLKVLKNKRGDPLTEGEIEAMYKGKPPISGGMFHTVIHHSPSKCCLVQARSTTRRSLARSPPVPRRSWPL